MLTERKALKIFAYNVSFKLDILFFSEQVICSLFQFIWAKIICMNNLSIIIYLSTHPPMLNGKRTIHIQRLSIQPGYSELFSLLSVSSLTNSHSTLPNPYKVKTGKSSIEANQCTQTLIGHSLSVSHIYSLSVVQHIYEQVYHFANFKTQVQLFSNLNQ